MLYQQIRPSFWQRHPVLTATAAMLVVWQLWAGWYVPLALTAVLVLTVAIRRRRRALAIRDAGLRARAELEHRLSLAGDARGIFGRYPPVQAGWFPDPQNPCGLRYFDGAVWTQHAVWR